MPKLEVLVATMHQHDFSKAVEMNLSSDAIFANQASENTYNEMTLGYGKIRMWTTNSRGVGRNRNLALLMADSEFCLLSDDDVVYVENYQDIIIEAFNEVPKADVIIFNITTIGGNNNSRVNTRIRRVNLINFLNYGSVRIAFRREEIQKKNIWFTHSFGGGTRFSAGEDSLFLREALRKKVKIYTYPANIGCVKQTTSTWFTGYNDKYFKDKGAFLEAAFPKLKYLLAIYFTWKSREITNVKASKIFVHIIKGMKEYRWYVNSEK